MFVKHKALGLFSLLLLSGCSGMGDLFPPSGNHPIQIESEPSGAEVYVMGEKIGVTPLPISQRDVFPSSYPKEKESLYGRVTLKKSGCADFTRTVSTQIVGAGLHARLDCADSNPAPTATSSPVTSGAAPRSAEPAEQRLEKIRELLNKGLISEEEAKKARARIIDEL